MLENKALIVKVTVHKYGFSAPDKKSQYEIAERHNIDPSLLNFNKLKFVKEDVSTLQKVLNKVVPFVHYNTLPWADGGWRLLTTELYPKFEEGMREITNELEEALDEMEPRYNDILNNAQKGLNSRFDSTQYHTFSYLKERCNIAVSYAPLPVAGDIRIDMQNDVLSEIKNRITEQSENALKIAMADVWDRTIQNITHLKERLESYSEAIKKDENKKPRLFNSTIEHIQNLVKMLPSMNLTNDPKLEEVRQKLESEFVGVTIDNLREDDFLREKAITSTGEILNNLEGVM